MNEKIGQSAEARGAFYLERGEMLMTALRYDDARKQFLLALGEDPNNPEIHCRLGVCCAELEDYENAIKHGRKAASLGPGNALVFQNLGWIYSRADNWKMAKSAAKEAVRIDPNFSEAYSLLASCYVNLEEYRKAAQYAKRAIALDPDNSSAHRVLAIATHNLEEDWEAERSLRNAFRSDPNSASTHLVMGATRLNQRDFEPAERHFREALRLDPTSQMAQEMLVIIQIETSRLVRWHAKMIASFEGSSVRLLLLLGILSITALSRGNNYSMACFIPLILAVVIFFFTRLVVDPLAMFQVACTSLGRQAMSKWDYYGSMLLSFYLLVIFGLGVAGIVTNNVPLLVATVFATYLYFPVFTTWHLATVEMRPVMYLASAILTAIGASLFVFSLLTDDPTNKNSLIGLGCIYVVACLVSLTIPRMIQENLN